MTFARTLGLLSLPLTLCTRTLAAQADSTHSIPNLSGTWRLTGPSMFGVLFATFRQTRDQLQVDIVTHGRCLGRDVKIDLTMVGAVDGDTVRLWSASRRLEGDLGDRCVLYAEFVGHVDFAGVLSADGKRFQGTYDRSGQPTHMWIFSR
jgi:hypothetical protein